VSGLADRLAGRRVIVCAGAGGVGKTTVSAAVAMSLAMRGLRVAVVTIDPARRLAESLGLVALDNVPRRIDPALLVPVGIERPGELWAMMLDAKRTFDELIGQLSPDERTRDAVLANGIYEQLSGAVAGSQEYTAMAKLYEVACDPRFDAIVLDTPPSRNAVDFLTAPDRLTSFLDGRALNVFLAPAGLARVTAIGASVTFAGLRRLTGVGLLDDLAVFFRTLGGLTEGFRLRAAAVRDLLAAPATTFLIVASPEPGPSEEAVYFAGRLRAAGLPFGGLVVNRVHPLDPAEEDQAATAKRLEGALGPPLARRVARAHAELQVLARRDAAGIERLAARLGDPDPMLVQDLDSDVHDLSALAAVEAQLSGTRRRPGALRTPS